jgi:predicted MFS family arabinose efflux permease
MITPVVEPAWLTTAMTLEMVVWNLTMIAGPIVGGIVLAAFGLEGVYALSAACHAISALTMLRLEPQAPAGEVVARRFGIAAVKRGLAYLRPRPILRGILWTDLIVMALAMRRSLFPVLAVERFHAGAEVVGVLMAAIPAGALLVSLTGNWLVRVRRQGLWVVVAAAVWGIAMTAFGLSGDRLPLAVVLLAIAGGAHIVAAILRGTIIHQQVPLDLRGRVWGINFLVLNGGPRLGDLSGGVAASFVGASASVVGGSLAALAGLAIYTVATPSLLRYRSREEAT